MEDADKLMLRTLRDLDCDVPQEAVGLAELSTEQIVDCVVRCLHIINPDCKERIKAQFPANMSARFKLGSRLAEECGKVGCSGDLGYQTFLYPSEKEIRNIFLHLLEKLPRQGDVKAVKEDSLVQTNRIISKVVGNLLKTRSPAGFASSDQLSDCEEFHAFTKCYPSVQRKLFDIFPEETRTSGPSSIKKKRPSMLASLIETNALLRNSVSDSTILNVNFDEKTKREIAAASISTDNQATKGRTETVQVVGMLDYTPQGGREEVGEEDIGDKNDEKGEMKDGIRHEVSEAEKKQSLLKQKDELELKMLMKLEEYKKLKASAKSHEEEMISLKSSDEGYLEKMSKSQQELEKHKKILQLLPNAEENLSKLMTIVQKSKEKLQDLESQWDQHREGLGTEYEETISKTRQLQEKYANHPKALGPSLEEKIEKTREEINSKENLIRNLRKEFDSLKKEGNPREFYTNRILDLNSQIEKLRTGVDKVIMDVKTVQKEINNLNGKLERTFIEISITMENKINNKEPYIEQSLEVTKKIHKTCNEIVEIIRKTGSVGRELRDMEAQIKNEESRDLKSKIGKLSQDFRFLQKENASMAQELKSNMK